MKLLHRLIMLVCVVAAPVINAEDTPAGIAPADVRADQSPSKDGKNRKPIDVRSLLKRGQASGSLPEGSVVRAGACLEGADAKASGERVPDELAGQARTEFRARADNARDPSNAGGIAWGAVVNGLQLGISPRTGDDGVPEALFDGTALHINVHVRNAGKSPVRYLASTFRCVATGPGAAIPVTKLILAPSTGGEPLSITYQGGNHLRLLDKRRPKSEPWQKTIGKSIGSDDEIQLDAKDVASMSTLLTPGQTLEIPYPVNYTPGEDSDSSWRRTGESNAVPDGKYQLKAVFSVDQKVSPWRGELTSGSLEVEIHRSNKK